MKIFAHSGHLGDVLYSLPAIKILSGGQSIIHVKEKFEDLKGDQNHNTGDEIKDNPSYNQYEALKDLLLLQPFVKEVKPFAPPNREEDAEWRDHYWPHLIMDYDLDRPRFQRGRKYIFHIKRYFDAFNITEICRNISEYERWLSTELPKFIPWLTIDEEKTDYIFENAKIEKPENYAIFHVTDRWHGFLPDWQKIYRQELHKYDKIYFTGYKSDYHKFENQFSTLMDYLPTDTLLDLARVVRDAQAVYCNQNCCLVLAQGLGKKYYLARNADRTHCHTGLPTENLI